MAGLAVFLASRDSDYVTGTTYCIDGGLTVFYQEQLLAALKGCATTS